MSGQVHIRAAGRLHPRLRPSPGATYVVSLALRVAITRGTERPRRFLPVMLTGGDPLRHSLQEAVGGQYEIIRLLGRGGMGAVYLAGDTLERLVAIKVILPAAFADRRKREDFRKEMRTVAQFDHPNIVQIYTSGALDELDWFVMKFVSGDTLAERLQREPRMPPEEARLILVDLADALYYAHGHKIGRAS